MAAKERKTVLALLLAFFGLGIVAYIGTVFGAATEFVQETVYLAAPVIAFSTGLYAIIRVGAGGKVGKSLLGLTFGILFWLMGEMIWEIYEYLLGVDPFPSVADIFYLLGYIPFFFGMYLQIKGEAMHAWRGRFLLLAALSLALIGLVGYAGIYLAYDVEASALENTIAIAYGLGDLVLVIGGLFMMLLSIEYRGGQLAVAGWVFFLGLAATLAADILFAIFFGQYEEGILAYLRMDLLWIFGYLAFAYSLYYRGSIASAARKKLLAQRPAPKPNA